MKIGYGRVSTNDQNIDLQIDALKAAGCEKVFIEKASGANRDRPQLKAALEYLRDGDTLVVWKLDRLARSLSQLITTVNTLQSRNIGLLSITQALDTSTPGGKLVFHIFGAIDEFERELIRERSAAGRAAALARGKKGGRPAALSEADKAIARTLLANPEITMKQIAKRLNISEPTLYRTFPGGRAALKEAA